MNIKTLFLPFIAISLAVTSAKATTFDELDYLTSGDGLLIRDTVTGREWVDVAKTTGMSVNQFLTSSIFSGGGFQIAKFGDLNQFYNDAGASIIDTSTNPAVDGGITFHTENYAAAAQLQTLMEHSAPWSQTAGNPWIHGYVDFGSPTNLALSRFMIEGSTASFGLYTNGSSWTRDYQNSQIGIWAFRESSSVPDSGSTIAFLGLALFVVAGVRRKLGA